MLPRLEKALEFLMPLRRWVTGVALLLCFLEAAAERDGWQAYASGFGLALLISVAAGDRLIKEQASMIERQNEAIKSLTNVVEVYQRMRREERETTGTTQDVGEKQH